MTEAPEVAARRPNGFALLLLATAIGGIVAYVITWLVPRVIGFESYAVFAIFWGFLFLAVSALSGIQQEVARATRVRDSTSQPMASAFRFGAVVAGLVLVAIAGSSPLWVSSVFPVEGFALVAPIAVGAASYVAVAVVGGTLYGLGSWLAVFWLIATEALLRLAAVAVALSVTHDTIVLAWTVALPFPAAILVLFLYLRRRIRGAGELDVGYRALTWNVTRTIVASASMGALVSGLPLLLGVTSQAVPPAELGLLLITMTLTRAPLIVVIMALQSYLLVTFRSRGGAFWRIYIVASLVVLAAGAVLAVLGYVIGPPVFALLFPTEAIPGSGLIAALVLSSAAVALLCLSAPAVLAKDGHSAYSLGWLLAAILTIVLLMLPLPFLTRVMLALFVAPAAGLLVHLGYLAVYARRSARQPKG